jgi:hypothetical protein
MKDLVLPRAKSGRQFLRPSSYCCGFKGIAKNHQLLGFDRQNRESAAITPGEFDLKRISIVGHYHRSHLATTQQQLFSRQEVSHRRLPTGLRCRASVFGPSLLFTRYRIDDGDGKVLKVICIKGQKLCDPLALHRRYKPCIVRSDPLDSQILHQCVPSRREFLAIREQCESSLEENQPLARLLDGHSKSVLSGRRRTWLACCDGPELVLLRASRWARRQVKAVSQR